MTTLDLILLILINAGLFAAVALLIWNVFGVQLRPEPPVNRRIALALGVGDRETVFETPVLRPMLTLFLVAARRFPFFRGRIRQDLEASGNPNGYSVEEYLAICLAGGTVIGLVGVLGAGLFGPLAIVVGLGAPILGVFAPLWALREAARSRTFRIAHQLPYTLDLIAIMMEAGAAFSEAIDTVVRDDPEDDLNQELRLVQAEIEFGTTRAQALLNLADRIPLRSLRGVVGAINQSEALGSSLSAILKSQATTLRNQRSVRAEEAAAKASLRILVPSMLILLAVILIVFSPIIVRWRENGFQLF